MLAEGQIKSPGFAKNIMLETQCCVRDIAESAPQHNNDELQVTKQFRQGDQDPTSS